MFFGRFCKFFVYLEIIYVFKVIKVVFYGVIVVGIGVVVVLIFIFWFVIGIWGLVRIFIIGIGIRIFFILFLLFIMFVFVVFFVFFFFIVIVLCFVLVFGCRVKFCKIEFIVLDYNG